MKVVIRTLAIILVLLFSVTAALADCRVVAVSNVTNNVANGTLIAADSSGVPAPVAAGGTSEPVSGVLISEDNAIGAPQCFGANQVITLSFNARVTSPAALSLDNFTVYDAFPSIGLAVAPVLTHGMTSDTLTITVSRAGSLGDPTATTNGSAIWIKNFSLDLSLANTGDFASAAVSTSLPGSRYSSTNAQIAIGAVGQAGPLNISSSSLNFGDQIVNTASQAQTVQLTNKGTLSISVSSVDVSAPFSQTNTCGSRIAAGASCSIFVVFSPATAAVLSGTLRINDNATGAPHIVALAGNGIGSPGTPVLTALNPDHVIAGGPTFQLLVTGSNFGPGSTVRFNSSPRPTTYVSVGTLRATIAASDILNIGTGNISVTTADAVSATSLSLTIVANPLPTSPFQYALPHVVQGGGFVTKITLSNLSNSFVDSSIVVFLNQNGSVASIVPYSIPPLGTVRLTTPESARFGPLQSPQWAVVGSQTQLGVNLFYELADSTGKNIVNTVGFNNAVPATDMSIPVEFERPVANGAFTRTAGVALANMSDTANQVTLQLFNAAGKQATGKYVLQLPAYGQTAIDLSQVPLFANAVLSGSLIGTLNIAAAQPVSSIALVDDVGPFASTPAGLNRANLRAEDIAGMCPAAAELTQINRELSLSFESDPTAGTLVCRTAEGSLDLTQAQLRAYQAIRVLRSVSFDAPLPFTARSSTYDWLRSAILGIRFRGDITTSSCCTNAKVLDIAMTASSPALLTSGWVGSAQSGTNTGLETLVGEIVRLARISEGVADSCGARDQTIGEMGPWAVALDWQDFLANRSAEFFNNSASGESALRFRDIAAQIALGYVSSTTSKFCGAVGIAAVQPAAGVDFGDHAIGDPPLLRSVTLNSANSTPYFPTASTITGSNTNEFRIKSDTCDGQAVPPSCVVVISFQPGTIGARSAQLVAGTAPAINIPLTGNGINANSMPASPYLYYLPHVVTGGGYVTKITLANQAGVPNEVVLQFLTQAGTVAQSTRYTIAGGGTLRVATPESSRFGATTTQWAVVGSTQPLLANLFFEVEDTSQKIINTIGFNSADRMNSFSFPVEFEPAADGSLGRTAGLAMANPGSTEANYSMTLFSSAGVALAAATGKIPAFGQVALDLANLTTFKSVLPKTNFVGSVQVQVNGRVASIALEDDFGPFSATPVVAVP